MESMQFFLAVFGWPSHRWKSSQWGPITTFFPYFHVFSSFFTFSTRSHIKLFNLKKCRSKSRSSVAPSPIGAPQTPKSYRATLTIFTDNLTDNPFCPSCGNSLETLTYFLFECPFYLQQRSILIHQLSPLLTYMNEQFNLSILKLYKYSYM